MKLAQSWGSVEFADYAAKVSKDLLAQVDNPMLSLDQRINAAREVVSFRSSDNRTVSDLLSRVNSQIEPALGVGIVEALALSQSKIVGPETCLKKFAA